MEEKSTYTKFHTIVDSICYWMGYQVHIGRKELIHEASLRYPIADAITSEDEYSIKHIILEKTHPLFKSKRIDLVTEKNNSIQEAFEFKIAKYTKEESVEHQRVFDDVVRLAYYHMVEKKDCYFLMCGSFSDFKQFFVGDNTKPEKNQSNDKFEINATNKNQNSWTPKGIYENWFSFSQDKENSANIKTIKFEIKNEWGLKKFKESYKLSDKYKDDSFFEKNEINITTKCLAITPYSEFKTYAAGIWKIESSN